MRHLSQERSWRDHQATIFPSALLLLFSACIFTLVLTAKAQQPTKPLSKEQVTQLLKGGDPPERMQYLVIEHGIDFAMDTQTVQDLTQAGANHELIMLLRRLAPAKPPEAAETTKKESQTDTQIFDFQFDMPHGWRRVETADANKSARLEPSNLPPGTGAILIFPGEDLNGDLRTFFDRKWAEYKRSFRVIRELQTKFHKSTEGLVTVATCAALQDQNDGKIYDVCFHAFQAARAETDAVVMTETAPQSIMQDYNAFFHSVRFVNPPVIPAPSEIKSMTAAPPPQPAILAEGMRNGIYVGLQRAVYSFHIEHRFLYFYPDGWAMLGMPKEGLDDFDFQAYRNALRDKSLIGHYRVYGNRVDIIWLDSPDHRESHDLDESAPDIHGPYYVSSCGNCKGKKFDGTYQWEQSTLQFLSDGTFVDRGCIDQVLTIELNHPRFGTGTYRIGNYSLTLNYADGRRLTKSFVMGKNAAWLAISEIMLHPLGYRPMP